MRKTHGKFRNVFGVSPQDKLAPKWLRKCHFAFRNQSNRCQNKNCKEYKTYGAIGIRVDYNFLEFAEWFKTNKPKSLKNYSVGRVDHSKSYSLSNIKFQTKSDNSKERIERCGVPLKKRSVTQICGYTGLPIREFSSIKEAAMATGYPVGSVHRWVMAESKCNKTWKHLTKKHHFVLGV